MLTIVINTLGDAMSNIKQFNMKNFALTNKANTVSDFKENDFEKTLIVANSTIENAILRLDKGGMQILLVVSDDLELIGTITDGDIRRGLEKFGDEILSKTSEFLMSEKPKWISSETLAISALELMEKHSITSLFVFSDSSLKKPDGIVHIHDILKSGIQ